jgi:hypothetical protein
MDCFAKETFDTKSRRGGVLGRYSHKFAISNQRIKSIDNRKRNFWLQKVTRLPLQRVNDADASREFIRRFALYICLNILSRSIITVLSSMP